MKIYITLNHKGVSFATTIVLIFVLIFISLTNPSLTYAATKDSGFNSNTATSGPSGYIPPPQPLTTSTAQKDQIANNNNLSAANTVSSSSNGQSQLKQGQQPNSNCNTIAMVECGGFNPSKTTSASTTTTPTQQQPQKQLDQNGALTNNNNLNTFGPINPEGKYAPSNLFNTCIKDLTGKWHSNDGGVYYIDQKGDKIRWFGSTLFNDDAISSNKGFEYANEAQGHVAGLNSSLYISLTWDDINIGDNHLNGKLYILVDPSGSKMVKYAETGGFGASEWTRTCGVLQR